MIIKQFVVIVSRSQTSNKWPATADRGRQHWKHKMIVKYWRVNFTPPHHWGGTLICAENICTRATHSVVCLHRKMRNKTPRCVSWPQSRNSRNAEQQEGHQNRERNDTKRTRIFECGGDTAKFKCLLSIRRVSQLDCARHEVDLCGLHRDIAANFELNLPVQITHDFKCDSFNKRRTAEEAY